jgi:hypothetical protein
LAIILIQDEGHCKVHRISHFLSLSSFASIPHQLMMDTQLPQPGMCGSESSELMGATSNTSLIGTQQESGEQLVHRTAPNIATKLITLNAQ